MRIERIASRLITAIAGVVLLANSAAFAQTQAYKQLSAQWWQWILSIPVADNPLTDATGEKCMVGQRGSDWFLAGTFGGPASRNCSIPEGTTLFFPVINSVNFDTPNACGQGPDPIPSSVYRGFAAGFINGATNLSVLVDGQPTDRLQRVQSPVFAIALPQDNLFAAACAAFGGLPAGIYSPAVDDGIYVRLNPLTVGPHELRIHAENAGAGFILDVTYHITVVPVVAK